MNAHAALFQRLKQSKFRNSFHLKETDKKYIKEKGMNVIEQHACDFVLKRLSDKEPENDGSQTPMKGHPVFIAQHATGTCCRGCLEKWHHIPKGYLLSLVQQKYIVSILIAWIDKEMNDSICDM